MVVFQEDLEHRSRAPGAGTGDDGGPARDDIGSEAAAGGLPAPSWAGLVAEPGHAHDDVGMPPAPERSLRATINQLMAPERSGADLAGRVVEGEETARVPPEAAVAPPEPAAPTEAEAAAGTAPTDPRT